MTRRLTDLMLERYAAESLTPAQKAEVQVVLTESPADAEAFRLLLADTAAQWVTNPPGVVARRLAPAPSRLVWLTPLVAVAAAVALFMVWPARPVEPDLLPKGADAWSVTVTRSGSTAPLAGAATAGDVLSFQVTTAEPRFVAVVSVAPDGVFVYAPAGGGPAVSVKPGVTLLPHAAALDASTGPETLVLASCTDPFETELLRQVLVTRPHEVAWRTCRLQQVGFVKR